MTDDDKIILGNEAKALLGNELLRNAFDRVEKDAVESLLKTNPADEHGRTSLIERIKATRLIWQELDRIRIDGVAVQNRRESLLEAE